MLGFFQSLGIMGWLLIALALATLWQLPAIVRMFVFRMREGGWLASPGASKPRAKGIGRKRTRRRD